VGELFRDATDPILERSNVCPHCGGALCAPAGESAESGPFSYRRGDGMYVGAERLVCAPRVHDVIGLIFLARPKVLSKESIATQLSYSSKVPTRLIDVYLSQARMAARKLGEELPITTLIGRGVKWGERPFVALH
jgi:DNA-binding winged helix-turn-helix (wHTH) protein